MRRSRLATHFFFLGLFGKRLGMHKLKIKIIIIIVGSERSRSDSDYEHDMEE